MWYAFTFVCVWYSLTVNIVYPNIYLLKPTGYVMHQQFNIQQL
jgi:hypothetical protein